MATEKSAPAYTPRSFIGTYTGDGSESQKISGLPFAPKYVKIWRRPAVNQFSQGFETTTGIVGHLAEGASHNIDNGRLDDNRIISIEDDGFTVDDNGSNSDPNKSGQLYDFWAVA